MAFGRKNKKKGNPAEDGFSYFENFSQNRIEDTKEKVSISVSPYASFGNTQRISDNPIENVPTVQGESLVGVSSIIGRRSSQQDAVYVSSEDVPDLYKTKWCGVLCDGMGGMNGGEIASGICVRTVSESFASLKTKEEADVPGFYRDVISSADYEVSSLTDGDGNPLGAGTTFTSCIIQNGCLYFASVGDSHIYVIRDNDIKLVVREHNYHTELLEMVKNGEITLEEAESDKRKEALTSFIGIGGVSLMDVSEIPVQLIPGDVVMLCSDGLYRVLSDQEILGVVREYDMNMNGAAKALTDFAMMKNNKFQDNTSVVLAKYKK